MFQYKRDFEKEYCDARDLVLSRSLNPEMQTFADWLSRNKSRIAMAERGEARGHRSGGPSLAFCARETAIPLSPERATCAPAAMG